jgi:hypothetical protein
MESEVVMAESPSPDDAAEALRLVQTERQRVATTLLTQARWYAPVYGTLVGIAVLVLSGPWRWIGFGGAFVVLSFVGLMHAYRQATGVWISAAAPEAPRAQVVAVTALLIGGLGVALLARHVWDLPWIALVAAVVTGTGAALLSRSFDRAHARNLARD